MDCSFQRNERIRSIIYLHPVIVDKSKVDDVRRNIKMLRKIVPDPVQNIVVVTTGDQIPVTANNIKESKLPGDLTGRGFDKPLRHDGTKLSALIILANATKKTAIRLDLKQRTPDRTDAGKELTDHITTLRNGKRERDLELETLIRDAEDEESENVKNWKAERAELERPLDDLKADKKKLGVPITLEQATKNNEGLERAIKEQRDSATKDWKVEYDKKVVGSLCSVDLRSGI